MKKFILLFILSFLFTGCQVKYELQFNDDILKEKIQIEIPKEEKKIADIKKYKAYSIYDNNYKELYDTEYDYGLINFRASYQYQYNYDSFRHAMYIKNCFDAFSFVMNEDTYILSTSKGFNCMVVEYNKVDNVEIKITSNHEIIESNADEVKKNQLVWNIDSENAFDKAIYVKFGQVKKLSLIEKIKEFITDNLITITVFGSLFLIVMITIIIILLISKKNNAID